MDMKWWRQFENSGKIEDYLTYVTDRKKYCVEKRESKNIEGQTDARGYYDNGDCPESFPGWRV